MLWGKAREIAVPAALAAVLFAAQVLLAVLPNIETVSLLVILYAQLLGRRVFPLLAVFALLEGLFYGFGIWWVSYLYLWPLLALLALGLRRRSAPLFWACLSGLYGACFGALCAIPYALAGGPAAAFAYWVSGIPFDLLHALGNFAAALVLYRPLRRVLTYALERAGML